MPKCWSHWGFLNFCRPRPWKQRSLPGNVDFGDLNVFKPTLLPRTPDDSWLEVKSFVVITCLADFPVFFMFFQQPTSSSSTAMDACCSFCVLAAVKAGQNYTHHQFHGTRRFPCSRPITQPEKPLVLTLTLMMKWWNRYHVVNRFFTCFFGSNITLFFSWLVGLGLRWAFCRISWSSSSARLQKLSWAMLIFTGKWGTILINHVVKGRFKTWCVREMWGLRKRVVLRENDLRFAFSPTCVC